MVLSPPPRPRLWLKCNRLLRLGRPVGAITLSRWEWWWNERWIWGARGGPLNLISTNYPDHGHHGRLPLSRKNVHGRAGNRTRDLMVSSQELWPPSHEAGHVSLNVKIIYLITIIVIFKTFSVFWRQAQVFGSLKYAYNCLQLFHIADTYTGAISLVLELELEQYAILTCLTRYSVYR